jgi:hypothetical protein
MTATPAENNLMLYVYYKISVNDRASCLLAVKKLDQIIKSHYPNLKIQHQKRPHLDAENKETWMETYTDIPDMQLEKFTAILSQLAEKNGLPKERKYEVFITL